MPIKVSVVLPVKDGCDTVHQCLEAIFNQSLASQLEVIVIDSGSTDSTLDTIKDFPVRLKQISPQEFNHGATRNLGVTMANGEFIVMTVQDAMATDNQWLEKMVRHFDDPEVAGVCGQQIVPHDKDKNPHQWFRPVNPPSVRSYQFKDYAEFEALKPAEKRWICGWDDVNAMYRGAVLRDEIPFRFVSFGEDLYWARDALQRGYKIVYDSNSRVTHYHSTNFHQQLKRKKEELRLDYEVFNLEPKSTGGWLDPLLIIFRNVKFKASPKWIFYNLSKKIAEMAAVRSMRKQIKAQK